MVHNQEKYLKAKEFRKRGFSYSEISNILSISKGTLANWFKTKAFSKKVKQDNEIKARRDNLKRIHLLNKARDKERLKHYRSAEQTARLEFKHYKPSPLFILGLGIYLTVGDLKHPSQIRVPSQRSEVHRSFQRFLKEFLGADKQSIYHKAGVTIFNDVQAKKKLLVWIDRLT